jgi:hypothetical protein
MKFNEGKEEHVHFSSNDEIANLTLPNERSRLDILKWKVVDTTLINREVL